MSVEEDIRDAERYRFLRDKLLFTKIDPTDDVSFIEAWKPFINMGQLVGFSMVTKEKFDSYIDFLKNSRSI